MEGHGRRGRFHEPAGDGVVAGGQRALPAALAGETFVVLAQFFDDGVGVPHRVRIRVKGRDIHDVEQDVGTLQVAQELVAKPGTVGGAFDEAGNVGDHDVRLGDRATQALASRPALDGIESTDAGAASRLSSETPT